MGNYEEIVNENKHFYDIKTGLKESMVNINKTLDSIKTWDELINLKEESIENNRIKKTKTIKGLFVLLYKFMHFLRDFKYYFSINNSSRLYNYFKFFI